MMRAATFIIGLAIATGADAQADTYLMALQLAIGGVLIWISLPGGKTWPRN